MKSMIRKQILLTEIQINTIKLLSDKSGASQSEVIRRILDKEFNSMKFRVIAENSKTNVRSPGSWQSKEKAQLTLDSLGKKSGFNYYLESKGQ